MSRMAWNSGSTCPSSTTGKSYPRARRQDLNSWWSSLPDLSLSKCLCEQNHVCYFKLFIHKPATRQHQFVSIEEICILSMFHLLFFFRIKWIFILTWTSWRILWEHPPIHHYGSWPGSVAPDCAASSFLTDPADPTAELTQLCYALCIWNQATNVIAQSRIAFRR